MTGSDQLNHLHQYYTTIYAQAFSPCGKFLAAGNNYGKVILFNLSPFLSIDENVKPEEEHRHPTFMFQAHKNAPIYSMVSSDKFLITGSIGEIAGWSWRELKKKEAKPCWVLTVPQGDSLTKPEVNGLALGTKNSSPVLFAGCGDNNIYCWDLEMGKLKYSLEGHQDYIHCITLSNNEQECLSGSEDGTVRIWDTRKVGEPVHLIEPFKHEMLHRPRYGKWVGCVALDSNDDWMVCGGGPSLCIWHLRSLSPAVTLTSDSTSTVAFFHEDMVVAGGSAPFAYHWSFTGDLKAEVPTSATNVYSIIASNKGQQKILSIGGTDYMLDICTNFMYRDFSLMCT